MIAARLGSGESVFSFLTPMACALLGFYMLLKAVPQFASSVMTGSVSGMDGGAVRAAAAAGYGMGMSVWSKSRTVAQGAIGAAGTVSQAVQTYQYTSQAARDTGSSPGEARKAGALEAFKTIMTGPQAGGPRAAGDKIYSDHQRAAQYADVRNAGGAMDSLSSPASSATSSPAAGASANNATNQGNANMSSDGGEEGDYWGSYESDRRKDKGERT